MEAVIIVLNDLNYMEEILEVFVKFGVDGATIVDSYGMGKVLRESNKVSHIMKGTIERSVPEKTSDSKTIFSIISKEKSTYVVETIRHLLKLSSNNIVGIVFSMPINEMHYIK